MFVFMVGFVSAALMLSVVGAAHGSWLPNQRLTWDYAASTPSPNNAHTTAAGPEGSIHIVWADARDGNDEIYYRQFNGAGWGPEQRLTTEASSSTDPSIAVDPAGGLHVAWVDLMPGTPEIHYMTFDGISWSAPEQLTEGSIGAENPCVSVDDSANVHLVWRNYSYGAWGIYYSMHDGIEWSEEVLLTEPGSYPRRPSIAADDSGRLYVIWDDYRDGNHEIYCKTYDGAAWGADERITNDAGLSENPSAAVDDSAHVHVVWDDDRSGTFDVYHKIWNGVEWSPDEVIANGLAGARAPAVTVGDSGKVFVTWYDEPGYKHVYFIMFDGITWGGVEQLTTASRDSDRPSIALDTYDQAHVVWREDVRYASTEIYWAWRYDGTPPAPQITSVEPDSGRSGDTLSVTVNGADFLVPESVWFEAPGEPAILATDFEAISANQIVCDFDLLLANYGAHDVIVRNIDGQTDTLVSGFYIVPAGPRPVVSSITPDTTTAWGEVEITNLAGDDFQEHATVRFEMDGEPTIEAHTVVFETPQKITCSINTYGAAAGFRDVIVENPDGLTDTLASGFAIWCSGWGPETRVTYLSSSSHLAEPNARSMVADAAGNLHVVWYLRQSGTNDEIYYKMFDGNTWGSDQRLTNDANDSENPAVAVDDDGSIHVVWSDNRDGNSEIYYKKYDGVSWGPDTRLTGAYGASGHPAIAVYDGKVYVVWHDGRGGNHQVYSKRYNGTAWEADYRISTNTDGWSQKASVVADEMGQIHVVWQGNIESGADLDIYYRKFDGSNWGPDTTIVDDPGLSFLPCIAAGPGDDLHVTWYDDRAGSYKIYYKHFDGAAWESDTRVSYAPNMSRYASVAADDSGKVHVAWRVGTTVGDVEIYYSRYDGLVWGPTTRLTYSEVGVSSMPCLAVCPAGCLHLIWEDSRDGSSEIYYKRHAGTTLAGIVDLETAAPVSTRPGIIPNPVHNDARVRFRLEEPSFVNLAIYDIAGRLVWKRDLSVRQPGVHQVAWDGCDAHGRSVANGVYFLRVNSGKRQSSAKIVVLH
jgi:hypothetical protein